MAGHHLAHALRVPDEVVLLEHLEEGFEIIDDVLSVADAAAIT